MPDNMTHLNLDELIFGKRFERVHHEKDVYAKWLGPSHRRIAHDPLSNIIIAFAQYPDDPVRAFLSGQVHDMVDVADTATKRASSKRARSSGGSRTPSKSASLLELLLAPPRRPRSR